MEKRNVVEQKRTPNHEISRADDNWDKQAADLFSKSDSAGGLKKDPKPTKTGPENNAE